MRASRGFARVKRLFLEASEREPENRSQYLDEACAGEPDLRREVEALLSFDRQPQPQELQRDLSSEVGPYRLLHKIGEGGMGEVWAAEQERPVRRRAAVKLIKWGMDTREVLARFESERQALALMNHPNIAAAYEAGATVEGRPFFAMEFVEGVPLNEYCDARRLSIRDRLELFVKVCDGLQHAHQKGVIHRDIKPSNILVAIEEGLPVPKIIDFGVAKATSQRLTERTLFTELGQWIGTPEYMSPEQAEITSIDIDTRSDVYSLGAVLYELLAGGQALDAAELRSAGFDEMRRHIREIEPPRPSTRVSSFGNVSREVAQRRDTDSRGLIRTLRGDLDWIVMKAMEKDRTRRYGSPSELAADIGRYLRSELVEASPPGTVYRMRKFIARHRAGVAAGAFIVVTLLAGVIGTALGLLRAQREAEASRKVAELLAGMFSDIDPAGQMGGFGSPILMLDRGAERIGRELTDEPVVQARLLQILGDGYRNMGRFQRSREALEASLRLRETHLEPSVPELGASLLSLGLLEYWDGNYSKAAALLERSAAVYQASLGGDDVAVAVARGFVGLPHWRLGDYEAARHAFEQSLNIYRTMEPEVSPWIAMTLHSYGILLMDLKDYEAARPMLERAIEIHQRALGPDHTTVGMMTVSLGRSYLENLRYDEARPLFERGLAIQERSLGRDHPWLASPLTMLATVDRRDGELEEARTKCERALGIIERFQGPEHPDLVWALVPYARILENAGEFAASREVLDRAVRIAETSHGKVHLDTARAVEGLGFHYYRLREYREALRHYRRAFSIREQVFGPRHPALAWNLYDQACILALSDDRPAALDSLRRAVDTGWANPRLFEDGDLDSLRDDPEFAAIADEVRSRLGRVER
ncbi:MAG: serine/threonine protein kinase [bacterium]|nr:serine/threonine protein kinase [bacterium]